MHFAHGAAQRLGGPEGFWVDAASSPDGGRLFALLAHDRLALWTAKPRLVVSQYRRGPESIARDGTNVALVWQADGTALAVLTSKGAVICIGIDPADGTLAATHVSLGHLSGPAYADGRGVPAVALSVRFVARQMQGAPSVLRIVGGATHVLCVHQRSVSLMSWRGIRERQAHAFAYLDDRQTVARIVAVEPAHSYALLMTDGSVHLLHLPHTSRAPATAAAAAEPAPPSPSHADVTPIWTPTSTERRATEIAYNAPLRRLAAGMSTGDVLLFAHVQREFVPLPTLPGARHSTPAAAVRALAWSSDGLALAVGCVPLHLSSSSVPPSPQSQAAGASQQPPCSLLLYNAFGTELATSQAAGDTAQERRAPYEMFPDGVRTLFWGPQSLHLYVGTAPRQRHSIDGMTELSLPSSTVSVSEPATPRTLSSGSVATTNGTASRPSVALPSVSPLGGAAAQRGDLLAPPTFYALPLAVSTLAMVLSPTNMRYPLLVCDDALLLDVHATESQHTLRPDVRRWRQLQITPMYLAENWPVRYVAAHPQGTTFAVAGTRGFAILNAALDKWKLFGNLQHERDFAVVGGLAWLGDLLAAAVQDEQTKEHELRFYSRLQNLDASLVLWAEKLAAPCQCLLATSATTLLVYTADNILREYAMTAAGAKLWKLEQVYSASLANALSDPASVRGVAFSSTGDAAERTVLALVGGDALLFNPQSHEPPRVLSSEALFCSVEHAGEEALRGSVWVAESGWIKFWLASATGPDPAKFPVDAVPVGIVLDGMVAVGAGNTCALVDGLAGPLVDHRIRLSTHLFLHHIISALLFDRNLADATRLAKGLRESVFFTPALELLLHQSLEAAPVPRVRPVSTGGLSHLELAIQFAEQFPQYLDVLVQCARKTEVDRWELLFRFSGNPANLFRECLATGRLRTAAQYLLILQNLESAETSGKTAMQLLEATLANEDYETGRELLRFLMTIFGCDELFSSGTRSASAGLHRSAAGGRRPHTGTSSGVPSPVHTVYQQQSPDGSLSVTSQDMQRNKLYLEILLARHARKLMQKGRLRSLLAFAEALSLPLHTFLWREHNRAAVVEDYHAVFLSLHEQFLWHYPDAGVPSAVEARSRGMTITLYENSAATDGESFATAVDFHRDSKARELKELREAAEQAECLDYVVLVGTMLGDVRAVALALRDVPPPAVLAQAVVEQESSVPRLQLPQRLTSGASTHAPTFSATLLPSSPRAAPTPSSWLSWIFGARGSGDAAAGDVADHFAAPSSPEDKEPSPDVYHGLDQLSPRPRRAPSSADETESSLLLTSKTSGRPPNTAEERRTLFADLVERVGSAGYRAFRDLVLAALAGA